MVGIINLWAACIEHRHGNNFYIAIDQDDLEDQIYEYVKEWWRETLGPLPENKEYAIEIYFEAAGDEWFIADRVPVEEGKLEAALI